MCFHDEDPLTFCEECYEAYEEQQLLAEEESKHV